MVNKDRFKDAVWAKKSELVLIGGAGGIGSWLALLLARIGHQIYIYDFDNYEILNMGGQFVNKTSIGMSKVAALYNLIEEFSGASINTYNEPYTENSPSTQYVFSAFDNMKARKIMFENWFNYNKSKKNDNALFIDGHQDELSHFLNVPSSLSYPYFLNP
jgi:tRNA A37 threonylcarbamoyladenosine dehydratase